MTFPEIKLFHLFGRQCIPSRNIRTDHYAIMTLLMEYYIVAHIHPHRHTQTGYHWNVRI